MKTKIILAAMVTSMLVYVLSSCYRSNADLTQLPVEKVSFRNNVVPIVTSGACGCHNLGTGSIAQFSHKDTIFYDVILARVNVFKTWAEGGTHPGMGTVDFTPDQKVIINTWIQQGPPYDAGDNSSCTTGGETYTATILPIYNTTCKGGSCHGNGTVVVLDYNKMVSDKTTLQAIMNSNGVSGHPGGTLSLTSCTVSKFKSWISLNMP